MNQIIPKVFISYSWHPEDNKNKVEQLARRLMEDGIDVVIDIWYLHAGMDKNVFMEKMVSDKSVNKVLLICNKEYAEKANARKGGVGTESTIMSEEIYSKAEQTKFIPIIFEKDEQGFPYLPLFVKSRINYDLSDDFTFEKNYEELLRDLYQKPKSQRPALGRMPEYLTEDAPSCLPTSHKVKAISNSLTQDNHNISIQIEDYITTFLEALKEFKVDYKNLTNENFITIIESNIQKMQPLKHDFIHFIKTICRTKECNGEFFVRFFERWLQFYEDEEIDLYEDNSIIGVSNDHYRFFNYDVFLALATVLLENSQYQTLHEIIKSTFYIEKNGFRAESISEHRFIEFQKYNYTLEQYKIERYGLNRVSVVADYVSQNARELKMESLVQTDILLYYLSLLYPSKSNLKTIWFPKLGCYNQKKEVLPKLISKRHFEQIKPLFGVQTIEEFKQLIERAPAHPIQDPNYWVSPIKIGLSYDTIGTKD